MKNSFLLIDFAEFHMYTHTHIHILVITEGCKRQICKVNSFSKINL